MTSIVSIKNGLKLAISVLQDGINELAQTESAAVLSCSAEVGETIDEKELQQLQGSWSRELVCPICSRDDSRFGGIPFIKEILKVEDNKVVGTDGTGINELLSDESKTEEYVDNIPRHDYCYDAEQAFDEHMLVVHGITIDHSQPEVGDVAVLRQYGPVCSDQRYGERIVQENKNPKTYTNKMVVRINEYEEI